MAKAVAFNCTSCGANLNITAVGHTISVVCHSCHAIIDTTNEKYQVLQKIADQKRVRPYIPIGTRGKMSGTKFEVIGFMERCDSTETYFWREYCLYNPYKGFYWLFEFDGHWTFFKTIKNKPTQLSSNEIQYLNDKTYQLFNSDQCKVHYVEGEFYWRVKMGDKSDIRDFIHPPYIISREKTRGETIWTYGKYVEAEKIQKVFKLNESPPFQAGVAPNQPSTYNEYNKQIWKMTWIFIALIFGILIARYSTAENKLIHSEAFEYRKTVNYHLKSKETDTPNSILSEPFRIEGRTSNLKAILKSSVDNEWLFADILLVDQLTGKGIPIPIGVEFWHGRSGGEYWKEGSKKASKLVMAIPSGDYRLNIIPSSSSKTPKEFTVHLYRDVPITSTFFWALALILLVPIWSAWKNNNFEYKRWSNSDFSPYWSVEDE